jgi:hypothetical protein
MSISRSLHSVAFFIGEFMQQVTQEQIESLANEIICDGATLMVIKNHLGVPSTVCEFILNDAIEETIHKDYATEVLRGVMAHKIDIRASYEASLIDYTIDRINDWLNDSYQLEVK